MNWSWSNYRGLVQRVHLLVDTRGRWALSLALAFVIAAGVLHALIPVAIGQLVDDLQANRVRGLGDAVPLLALMAAAGFFIEALTLLRKWLVESVCAQVEYRLSVEVVGKLLNMDVAQWSAQMAGEVNGRVRDGIDGAVRGVKLVGLDLLPVASTVIAAIGVVAWRGPRMLPILMLTLGVMVTVMAKQLVSQSYVRMRLLRARQVFGGRIVERLAGVETIQTSNRVAHEIEGVRGPAKALCEAETAHHTSMMRYDACKGLAERAAELALIAVAVRAFATGACSAGDVLVQLALLRSVMEPLRQLHRVLDEAQEAAQRIQMLDEIRKAPQDPVITQDAPALTPGSIEFTGLHTSHGSLKVLNGIELRVMPGEFVALVGRSGAGKSTLLKILVRHMRFDHGQVRIGGADLGALTRRAVSEKIAYVHQDPWIFAGTIQANIEYGGVGNFQASAIAAGLHEEVLAMPGGYARLLGERGQGLSGGQKKRLAIARALNSLAPILVLDEATSELDSKAIVKILDALRDSGRTVLFVTHQPEVMRRADRVVVIEEGVVRASGPFEALAPGEMLAVAQP